MHVVQKPEFDNKQINYLIHVVHVFVVLFSNCRGPQIKVNFIMLLLSTLVASELK